MDWARAQSSSVVQGAITSGSDVMQGSNIAIDFFSCSDCSTSKLIYCWVTTASSPYEFRVKAIAKGTVAVPKLLSVKRAKSSEPPVSLSQ